MQFSKTQHSNSLNILENKEKRQAFMPTAYIGEPDGIRTHDPLIKSQMLYQLSYGPSSITKQGIIDKKRLVNKKN